MKIQKKSRKVKFWKNKIIWDELYTYDTVEDTSKAKNHDGGRRQSNLFCYLLKTRFVVSSEY